MPELNPIDDTTVGSIFSVSSPRFAIRYSVSTELSQLDLSQFNLREPDLRNRILEMAPTFRSLVERIMKHKKDFWYIPVTRRWRKVLGLGTGTHFLASAIISKGALVVPFAGLAGGLIAVNTLAYRAALAKQIKLLKARIDDFEVQQE